MSLSISQHINSKLSASRELTEAIGERMYPVAVAAETTFPFIVYERTSVTPNHTKDGSPGDTVAANVYVFSRNYAESVAVAEQVRTALDGSGGRYATFEVEDCYLTDADEAFADNVFMQQLSFTIETYEL